MPTLLTSFRLARLFLLSLAGLAACRPPLPSSKPLGGIPYDQALAPRVTFLPKRSEQDLPVVKAEPVEGHADIGQDTDTVSVVATKDPEEAPASSDRALPSFVFKPLAKGWLMTEETRLDVEMKGTIVGMRDAPKIELSIKRKRTSVLEVKAVAAGLPTEFEVAHSNSTLDTKGMGRSENDPTETDGKRYSVIVRSGAPEVRYAKGGQPPDDESKAITEEAIGFVKLASLASGLNGVLVKQGQRVSVPADAFKKLLGSGKELKITKTEAILQEVAQRDARDAVRASVSFEFGMGEGAYEMQAQMQGEVWIDAARSRLLEVSLQGKGKLVPKDRALAAGPDIDFDALIDISAHYTYREP